MCGIPKEVSCRKVVKALKRGGLRHKGSERTCEVFLIPFHSSRPRKFPIPHELLLMVSTDRVSIGGEVLPVLMPLGGELASALTVFWLGQVLREVKTFLVAYGRGIDRHLPPALQGNRYELWSRAIVVRKLKIWPVKTEARDYFSDMTAWDCRLLTNSNRGRKAREINPAEAAEIVGGIQRKFTVEEMGRRSLKIFGEASRWAWDQGFFLSDVEFVFGSDSGEMYLAAQALIPDSSRFLFLEEWRKASLDGRAAPGLDQPLIDWWTKAREGDLLRIPSQRVVEHAVRRRLEMFWGLTGMTLEQFQRRHLFLNADPPRLQGENLWPKSLFL